MARPAPTPPDLDNDFGEDETGTIANERAALHRNDGALRPANDTGDTAATARLKEDVTSDPATAPLATNDEALDAPVTAATVEAAQPEKTGPRPAGRKRGAFDVGGIGYLMALALVAAAVSAAIVLLAF